MKKTLCIAAALLMLLTAAACAPASEPEPADDEEHTSYVYAMDTVMTLTAYGPEAEAALPAVSGAIGDLDSLLSTTDPDSDIYRINNRAESPVTVSDETAEIITRALELCSSTRGRLDISVYPVVRAWGFTTGEYRVPEYSEILSLLRLVDHSQVTVSGNEVSLSTGMMIDLGAVAKGYAGDRAAAILTDAGVGSAILNLGGNVRAVGTKPDGAPWRVGIQDPYDESSYFAVLSVTDKSVVTSGGYNRYFEEDGRVYWHILDPSTGCPANNGIISATIVGDDGLMCDGLSTAAFVMGVNSAFDYWREHGGFEMVLATRNGHIYVSSGLADSFELVSGYESEYTVEVVY